MRALLPALLLAAACHPAKPAVSAPTVAPAPQPQTMGDAQIKALLAREQPPMQRHEVWLDDHSINVSPESAGVPTLAKSGNEVLLTIPIGTTQPVFCHIAPEVDPASSLQKVFKALEKFPKREIVATDAGVIGGGPFLALTAMYVVEPQRLLGEVTMFAVRRETGGGVICTHDEPGYHATVRRVVASVAETLGVHETPPPKALCREIAVMSLGGRKVGFDASRVTRGADGRLLELELSSDLQLRTPAEFEGVDIYDVTHSKNGIIQDTLHVEGSGSSEQLELNVKLTQDKGASYHAVGTFKGKPVDLRVEAPDLFSGDRVAELVRTKILGKRGAELKLTHYAPRTDPSGVQTTLIRAMPDGSYQEIEDGIVSQVSFDENGHHVKQTAKIASQDLMMERVLVEGKCP